MVFLRNTIYIILSDIERIDYIIHYIDIEIW
jgi:hypothetical protein